MTATATREQAMDRLALANHVRSTNARMLHAIGRKRHADGLRFAADLLIDGDMSGPAGAVPIYRLLTAIRWVKRIRAESLLYSAHMVAPQLPLRRLTMRQRQALAAALEEMAEKSRAR